MCLVVFVGVGGCWCLCLVVVCGGWGLGVWLFVGYCVGWCGCGSVVVGVSYGVVVVGVCALDSLGTGHKSVYMVARKEIYKSEQTNKKQQYKVYSRGRERKRERERERERVERGGSGHGSFLYIHVCSL